MPPTLHVITCVPAPGTTCKTALHQLDFSANVSLVPPVLLPDPPSTPFPAAAFP